jgi:CMP-N-acetylneuraminic acid synthetase
MPARHIAIVPARSGSKSSMPARHIAIVPARSGSKSIKNKNLIKFSGKTLVRISCEQVCKAGFFDKLIVTSDYRRFQLEIDDLDTGIATKFRYVNRPKELATDEAEMIDVVKHALNYADGPYTYVWLIQPTSPFRHTEDFNKIKKVLEKGEHSACISVKPAKEHPNRMGTIKNEEWFPNIHANFKNKQELKPYFIRSGNFYAAPKDNILKHNSFENKDFFKDEMKRTYAYIMGGIDQKTATADDYLWSRIMGANIDDKEDYDLAKAAIKRGDFVV